jgi:hypothetical protein
MDHSQPQCGNGQQRHSTHSPSMKGEDILNHDEAEPRTPRHMPAPETLVISPASSSLGSPSQLHDSSPHDGAVPMNPFRLDFDDDRDERDSPLYNTAMMNDDGTTQSAQSNNNLSRTSFPNEEQAAENTIRLNRVPSLSLSTYSGYDTDEDEDGVLKRFHDQAKSTTRMMQLNTSLDDDESVYSAVNTEENEEPGSRSSSSHGGMSRKKKKKKKPADRIKDAIDGMRKAHEDARRQRSTRQFLAMSEGNRSAHSFTEAICLSPWCDFSSGRGMMAMVAVLFLLVSVVVTLIKFEHLAVGVWTLILGIVVILIRRFWVPIYWLVWGQFVEKRRRRNMQRYDTLNGQASVEMAVQNFEKVQDYDEREIEFGDEAVDEANGNSTTGELA